jgi:hypothetical protein
MNNEMMPLMAFLLQSEDTKKQADRIIQEVKNYSNKEFLFSKDVENIRNEFMSKMTDLTDSIKKLQDDLKNLYERLPDKKDNYITNDNPAFVQTG